MSAFFPVPSNFATFDANEISAFTFDLSGWELSKLRCFPCATVVEQAGILHSASFRRLEGGLGRGRICRLPGVTRLPYCLSNITPFTTGNSIASTSRIRQLYGLSTRFELQVVMRLVGGDKRINRAS